MPENLENLGTYTRQRFFLGHISARVRPASRDLLQRCSWPSVPLLLHVATSTAILRSSLAPYLQSFYVYTPATHLQRSLPPPPRRYARRVPPAIQPSMPLCIYTSTSLHLQRVFRSPELHTTMLPRLRTSIAPPLLHTYLPPRRNAWSATPSSIARYYYVYTPTGRLQKSRPLELDASMPPLRRAYTSSRLRHPSGSSKLPRLHACSASPELLRQTTTSARLQCASNTPYLHASMPPSTRLKSAPELPNCLPPRRDSCIEPPDLHTSIPPCLQA